MWRGVSTVLQRRSCRGELGLLIVPFDIVTNGRRVAFFSSPELESSSVPTAYAHFRSSISLRTKHAMTAAGEVTTTECSRQLKKQRLELPPPFVVDYAPYSRQQLLPSSSGTQAALKNWDNYYRNNTVNGYKDRHYILREFAELSAALEALPHIAVAGEEAATPSATTRVTLVEIGCGVGNAVLPLLEQYASRLAEPTQFQVLGFDISAVAVDLLKLRVAELGFGDRVKSIQHDLALFPLAIPSDFMPSPASFGTMIFVLSAVSVAHHDAFVSRIATLVAAGGVLMVRDYCADDHAQKRFDPSKKVHDETDATFTRSNGTLSHFFTLEEFCGLFSRHGFEPIEVKIVERQVENRKQNLVMERRWLNGRFRRK
jgi:methyltransferase-like protein 6